jgi:hypothetical protein
MSKDPSQKAAPVKVRKVNPYPFDGEVLRADGSPPIKGQIVKIVEIGLLIRVTLPIFKVGENITARFELPALRAFFNEPMKCVKTYDAHEVYEGPNKNSVKSYLVEFQFLQLGPEKKANIGQFCRSIGQVSK